MWLVVLCVPWNVFGDEFLVNCSSTLSVHLLHAARNCLPLLQKGRLLSGVERQLNHGGFHSPDPCRSLIWFSPLEFNVVLAMLIAFIFTFHHIIIQHLGILLFLKAS